MSATVDKPASGYPARPLIHLHPGSRPDMAHEAIGALAQAKHTYRRGPLLSQIVEATPEDDAHRRHPIRRGTPIIRELPMGSLLCELERRIEWKKYSAKAEDWVPADCPDGLARIIAAEGPTDGRLPDLLGVLQAPALRPDGTIINEHGYDEQTGYYLAGRAILRMPPEPSQDDAKIAWIELARLFGGDDNETSRGFPWEKPEDCIVPIAGLLTLLARPAIENPACVPAFFFDAPVRGSGKGTLVQICSLIVQGRTVAATNWPRAIEEQEKTLGAYALAAPSLLFLDNLRGTIAGEKLEGLLTNEYTGFRILGRMDPIDVPWRSLIMIAGNNAQLGGDMHRRMIVGRLQPKEEHPEKILPEHRRFPEIEKHALEHRERYIAAGLTILRAYALAGCPSPPYVASFGSWARLVGGALKWIKAGDITAYVGTNVADEEDETLALRTLANDWARLDEKGEGMTVAVVRAALYPQEVLEAARSGQERAPDGWESMREAIETLTQARPGTSPDMRKLGDKIRAVKGRNFNGIAFDLAGRTHGANRWIARKV